MKRIVAITTLAAAMLVGGTARAGWYLMAPPAFGNTVLSTDPRLK